MLRTKDAKMCCLGFDMLRRGFAEAEISNVGDPEEVTRNMRGEDEYDFPVGLADKLEGLATFCECENGHFDNSDTVIELMQVNDDPTLDESEREQKIKSLFADIDIEVEFIN